MVLIGLLSLLHAWFAERIGIKTSIIDPPMLFVAAIILFAIFVPANRRRPPWK
jgi:hypothetical protein